MGTGMTDREAMGVRLWHEGLSYRQIAAACGVTVGAVANWCRKHKLVRAVPMRPTVVRALAQRMQRDGAAPAAPNSASVARPWGRRSPAEDAAGQAAGNRGRREMLALIAAMAAETGPPGVAHIGDLEPHHCRWVVGDYLGWCGAPRVPGLSWCPEHAARVLRPVQPAAPSAPAAPPATPADAELAPADLVEEMA